MNSEPDFQSIVSEFEKLASQAKEKNRETSCDFNMFRLLPKGALGETCHSAILGDLLNPNGAHGQGSAFLSTFLDELDIEFVENRWAVLVAKDYLDIAIVRQAPYSVVIIENKCFHAGDRPNQLYRYWYKKIHALRKEDKAGEADDRIVYLTPSGNKQPEDQSLRRPDDGYDSGPEKVSLPVTPWAMKEDIAKWLDASLASLEKLAPENHRMIHFVKQYIDFWRQPMNNDLVGQAVAVFAGSPEKWNVYLRSVEAKDAIRDELYGVLWEQLARRFAGTEASKEWEWDSDPQNLSMQWYLGEFGKTSVHLYLSRELRFVLLAPTTKSVYTRVFELLNDEKFGPLLSEFGKRPGSDWQAVDDLKLCIQSPHGGPFDDDRFAWLAANESTAVAEQVLVRINRFLKDPKLTDLVRELNKGLQSNAGGAQGGT